MIKRTKILPLILVLTTTLTFGKSVQLPKTLTLLDTTTITFKDTIHNFVFDSIWHNFGLIDCTNNRLVKHFKYIGTEPISISRVWTGDPHHICGYPQGTLIPGKIYSFTVCFFHRPGYYKLNKTMGFDLSDGHQITFRFTGIYPPLEENTDLSNTNKSLEQIKDTTINYKQGKKYYVLDLVGSKQTIYFDSVNYDNDQPIIILIQNNTNDTVWISHSKGLVSSKHALTEESTRYLKPFECYSISLKIPNFQGQSDGMKPLIDDITIYYTKNFQEKQFHFIMKGNVQLSTLPKFEVEEHPDVVIAASPLPQSIIDYQNAKRIEQRTENLRIVEQKTANTIPEFEFRRELWIYPKSPNDVLPTNLTLKYFINDSTLFAKKRLDSLNHVYFKIPMELGDSVYCVLSSPEYGFIAKKTVVRERANDITISFNVGPKLNQPHYYDWEGNRVLIPKTWISKYFIEFDSIDWKNMRLDRWAYLDSLKGVVQKYGASLAYSEFGGFSLTCGPKYALRVCKSLGKTDQYKMISEMSYVQNIYDVCFESNVSQESAIDIFKENQIENILIWTNPEGLDKMSKFCIRIYMDGLTCSYENNVIIQKLLMYSEIVRISQLSGAFVRVDEH